MSIEKIKAASLQILEKAPAAQGKGEEATKQSLVLPMLDALGYDIWDPSEVYPEYSPGTAKGRSEIREKADFALMAEGDPSVYIEVRPSDVSLDSQENTLAQLFNATPSVKLGILTNGLEWRFFTDVVSAGTMDNSPFYIARMNADDRGLDIVARFAKPVFAGESVREFATELLYTARIVSFLENELDLRDDEPSEYLIRWVLKAENLYDGVVNQGAVDRFRPIVKESLTRVLRSIVRRAVSALDEATAGSPKVASVTQAPGAPLQPLLPASEATDQGKPQPTASEKSLALFGIAKSIFDRHYTDESVIYDISSRKNVPLVLGHKDTTGYFGVYFNKPSWWVMRTAVDAKKPWIGFNIPIEIGDSFLPEGYVRLDPTPTAEFRVAVCGPEDLSRLENLLCATYAHAIQTRASDQAMRVVPPTTATTNEPSETMSAQDDALVYDSLQPDPFEQI